MYPPLFCAYLCERETRSPRIIRAVDQLLCLRQNRELQIMKMLDHGNVTTLHHYFYTEGEKEKGSSRPSAGFLS